MIFHDVFRLKSTNLTILESNFKSSKNALKKIKSIFRIFKTHFKTFKFQFINIFSHLEDYKLIYKTTNQKIYVKDKNNHYNLTIDEQRSCSIMQHYQYVMNHIIKIVFNVRAQWSFLFTRLNKQSRQKTFFIFRNDILIEWWNVEENTLTWILNERNEFDKYFVDTASKERMMQNIKRILLEAKSMRITKSIFMFVFNFQSFQNELCKKKIMTIEKQLNHITKFINVI